MNPNTKNAHILKVNHAIYFEDFVQSE